MKYFLLFFLLKCQTLLAQQSPVQIQLGENAPMFSGLDQFGKTFDLKERLEKGPVVLVFYRGYWCPYCNKQLSELEDSLQFITEKGGIVVAVTPEIPTYVNKTVEKTGASFYILHDQDLAIMNAYHVSYQLEDELLNRYLKKNIDIKAVNGGSKPYLPVPACYIIGQDQKILYSFFDADYTKRATVDKLLKKL